MIATGATSAAFAVATKTVTSSTTVTITAGYDGMFLSRDLVVTAQAATDVVNITRAEYYVLKKQLIVYATSTSAAATLRVYVTGGNTLIGTLTNRGKGYYDGQFNWPADPRSITIMSNLGGSATRIITLK